MRGMRSCTLSECVSGMVPRFPGCAARPWASEFYRFAVGIDVVSTKGATSQRKRGPVLSRSFPSLACQVSVAFLWNGP